MSNNMPSRIDVPGPDPSEESRQMAEAVADLHYVVSLLVDNATELIPGEAVDELKAAWKESEDSMRILVERLIPSSKPKANYPAIKHETLKQSQLTGEVGKVKRSTLARLKDRFFMYFRSEPRTDEKRLKASDAAADYLEFGVTVVSSIPGFEQVVEVLSLVKQLLGVRAKRGS